MQMGPSFPLDLPDRRIGVDGHLPQLAALPVNVRVGKILLYGKCKEPGLKIACSWA
jgi:hypothetical protein